MRDKRYSDSDDDYDHFRDPYWIHSMVAATPETYAIRCFRDEYGKPQLDEKLVLFWAVIEWRSSNAGNVTMQKVIPVYPNSDGTHANVWVSGPDIDEEIMGYASRQQLEEKDGRGSREEWLHAAEDHLKDIERRYEAYRKERDERKAALENPSLS